MITSQSQGALGYTYIFQCFVYVVRLRNYSYKSSNCCGWYVIMMVKYSNSHYWYVIIHVGLHDYHHDHVGYRFWHLILKTKIQFLMWFYTDIPIFYLIIFTYFSFLKQTPYEKHYFRKKMISLLLLLRISKGQGIKGMFKVFFICFLLSPY